MSYPTLLVVLSAVSYRTGRFIALDTLIDGTRTRVLSWLVKSNAHGFRPLWKEKLAELIGCPYCITIWTSGATTALTWSIVPSMPLPLFTWLAAATGALVLWSVIDSD
jgi:hypothetical protein